MYFSPVKPLCEFKYKSEFNTVPVVLIIEPILFLWNMIFTFYYTRVRHSAITPFLGGERLVQRWVFPQGLRKQKQETTCSRSGVLCETGNRNRNNLRDWSPHEAAGDQNYAVSVAKKKLRCRSASESVSAGIWIIFSRVSSAKKRVFRRRSVGDWTKLRFGSQIFDKCMWHVCHDVCGVCGEDWQVGHIEGQSNWRFKLTLYSSSFSSLSFALSNPNSNCSSATCG